jgi:hypothetical protein
MSTQPLPLDQWHLLFHETMAAILRAKEAIKRQAGILGIANGLWGAARDLKRIVRLEELLLAAPDGALSEVQLLESIRSSTEILRSIEDLIDIAKHHGFTNRTLTAAPLESIRKHGEQIAEHLEVLELSVDPEVEELIRLGRQDFAEGRGIPLESLQDE